MSNKVLSVYITTYNRANMLKKTIDSILNQTYTGFDFFILDNASTDNTEELVKSYNNSNINYIRHNKNFGGIYNISYAFNHCQTEYIVILHDDDIVCENFVEEELKMIQNSNVMALSCNAYLINENDDVVGEYDYVGDNRKFLIIDDYFDRYIRLHNTLMFPATIYNTSFLKKNNINMRGDVGPCADVILHSDISRKGGKLGIINKKLIRYRIHKNQDSYKNNISMHVKLYNFLNTNEYYSKKFSSMKKEQKILFRCNSRNIISAFLKNEINYKEAKNNLFNLKQCLKFNSVDLMIYIFIINIIKICPWLTKIYEIVKKNTRR